MCQLGVVLFSSLLIAVGIWMEVVRRRESPERGFVAWSRSPLNLGSLLIVAALALIYGAFFSDVCNQ